MMCKHEFKRTVDFTMICAKCGEDRASDLYTQLAAANARIAELENNLKASEAQANHAGRD